jgi:hypothetical protein
MVTKPSLPHDCVGFCEQRGISQLQGCSRRHIGLVELGAPAVHGARSAAQAVEWSSSLDTKGESKSVMDLSDDCSVLSASSRTASGHFREINPLPTLSTCPFRSDRVRTFAPQRFDAVAE